MDIRLCLCTVPDAENGERLANLWLERGWAACVSRLPHMISHFVWEGRKEQAKEELLLIKTTPEGAAKIVENLPQDHPYDCPEWLEISANASSPYARWVFATCQT